jgi:hypothetical protein
MRAPEDENSGRLFDHRQRLTSKKRRKLLFLVYKYPRELLPVANNFHIQYWEQANLRQDQRFNQRLQFTEPRNTRQLKAEMTTVRQAETEKRRGRLLLLNSNQDKAQQRFFVLPLIRDILISQKPDSNHQNNQTDTPSELLKRHLSSELNLWHLAQHGLIETSLDAYHINAGRGESSTHRQSKKES